MQFLKNWGWVVALVIAILAFSQGGTTELGNKTASFWDADSGFKVNGTAIVDSSRNATFVATTLTGDLTVDTSDLFVDVSATRTGIGTSTPLDLAHVENSAATSTLIISSGGSAVGGRIILEDHDGAGCSEIAILNGTVAAKTVTCPSGI